MKSRLLFMAAWLLATPLWSASAEDNYSFGEGARGFLIRDYNEKLIAYLRSTSTEHVRVPKTMHEFSSDTAKNTRQLQAILNGPHAAGGRAGPAEFSAVGLAWPDDFVRCTNLIDCWEGTLNKLEGSSESEDTFPNVTFGIIGFTSEDGSLQDFLQQANAATNGAVFQLARERLTARDAAKFIELVEGFQPSTLKKNHEEFVNFAIRNPRAEPKAQKPRREVAQLFAAFDTIPHFRDVQLAASRRKSWEAELPDYREHLFGNTARPSLRIDLFCYDMTVLTNGPGDKALRQLEKTPWRDETERMRQVFWAMKKSSEYKEDEEKRADILERERCIIEGRGEVHEDDYDLRSFALAPVRE